MKTLVFDLDGTILDSRKRHKLLLYDILKELNININKKIINKYLKYKSNGYSTKKYLIQIYKLNPVIADYCSKLWILRIENWNYLQTDVLYNDSKIILENLSKKYNLVLLTARKNEYILNKQLIFLGIHDLFQKIICVDPLNAKIEKKEALMNLDGLFIYFGDTEVDYHAAMAVDMSFCIMNYGFRNKRYWKTRGIKTFSSLSSAIRLNNL